MGESKCGAAAFDDGVLCQKWIEFAAIVRSALFAKATRQPMRMVSQFWMLIRDGIYHTQNWIDFALQ